MPKYLLDMKIDILWNDTFSIEWWKMLLIGLFLLLANTAIFFAMWYCRLETIRECGYPKRSRKTLKKIFSAYSVWDKLLLIRPTHNAEKRRPMLFLNLICHYICLLALIAVWIGFFGCMITLADGWACVLLIMPELAAMAFSTAVMFIPDLIYSPSERKRYRLK